jgi:hypothetical protein
MKKTFTMFTLPLCADALNSESCDWAGWVQKALAQRKNPATEAEVSRLVKQLQRLQPAAAAAMADSFSESPDKDDLAQRNAQFQQTLLLLA